MTPNFSSPSQQGRYQPIKPDEQEYCSQSAYLMQVEGFSQAEELRPLPNQATVGILNLAWQGFEF